MSAATSFQMWVGEKCIVPIDMILTVAPRLLESDMRLDGDVEFSDGLRYQELIDAADEKRRLSLREAVELLADGIQLIDGTLSVFGEDQLIAELRAVDSTYWDVWSTDEALVAALDERFGG